MKKGALVGSTLVAAVLVGTAFGASTLPSISNTYISPIVKEKINTAINGTAKYDSMSVSLNGNVVLTNVSIKGDRNQTILSAPEITVNVSFLEGIKSIVAGVDPLKLISTITVTDPTVNLEQYGDGTWNINHLVKDTGTDSSMDFKGTVNVIDGTTHITTAQNDKLTVGNINSAIKFNDYPKIEGAASAVIDGSTVTATGSYTKGDQTKFEAFLKTDKLNLMSFKAFIPNTVPVVLEAGYLNNATISVSKDGDRLSLNGHAGVNDLKGHYKQYKIDKGSMNVSFSDSKINVDNATAFINEQLVSLSGNVAIDNADYPITATVGLHHGAIQALLPDYGVTGIIDTNVNITGTLLQPSIDGMGTVENLTYDGYNIDRGKFAYNYTNDVVSISSATLSMAGGELTGHGWYNIASESFEGYGQGETLPLSLGQPLVDETLGGTISGSVYAKGEKGKVNNIVATLHGDAVSYGSMEAKTIDASVYGDGTTYIIPYVNLDTGDGVITASGTATGETADIHFNGHGIPLAMLGQEAGIKASGEVDVTGRLIGPFQNPDVQFQFASGGGSIHNVAFTNLVGQGHVNNKMLTMNQTKLIAPQGTYGVQGTVDLGSSRAINLQADVADIRVETIAKEITDIPITGWLKANMSIGGTIDNPSIGGHLALFDGSVYGELITDASLSYVYKNDSLVIDNAIVHAYDSEIRGSGTLQGNALNFIVDGKNLRADRGLHNLPVSVTGYFDASGNLQGTLANPIFNGALHADALEINGIGFTNIDGSIYYDPSVINLKDLYFEQGNGKFQVHGGMGLHNKKLFGFAEVKNGQMGNIITLFDLPIHNFDGDLTGQVGFGGTTDDPDITVEGVIKNTAINYVVFGNTDIKGGLNHNKITVEKLRMPVKDGFIAAQGTADIGGDADMQVVASAVPIELVTPLANLNIPLTGIFDGTINIKGKTKNPDAQMAASLSTVSYNGSNLDHIYALATMKDWVIDVNQVLAERDQYKISVAGKVPVAAFVKDSSIVQGKNENVNLVIDLSKADLGVVPLFSSYVSAGSGDTSGKIEVTGPLTNLQAKGVVSISNGSLTFVDVAKPLQNINGTLTFSGEKADLTLDAAMGKGTAKVVGNANWSEGTLQSYSGTLTMDKLEVKNKYFTGPLSGTFTYSGGGDIPTLKGSLDLDHTTIDIPLSLESGESSAPINLDVTVRVGDKVRLYKSILYDMEVHGRAHFGGTTVRPRVTGGFIAPGGTIKYLNTCFRITEARADFSMPYTFLPVLHVKAQATLSNYKIDMAVDGPPDQMQLTLTSDPPLTQEQIISLLTLKTTNEGINSNGLSALVAGGLEMAVFGTLESELQDHLGIDQITLSTNYLDPFKMQSSGDDGARINYYSLEVGKYILPNLMATVGTGLNYDLTKVGLQYYLNRNFNFNAWQTSNDNYFIGGQWRYRFK